jgi:hypothetical protein
MRPLGPGGTAAEEASDTNKAAPWRALMTVTMTKGQREAFLTGVHVAIVGIPDDDRGPLTAPVWYWYEPSPGCMEALYHAARAVADV